MEDRFWFLTDDTVDHVVTVQDLFGRDEVTLGTEVTFVLLYPTSSKHVRIGPLLSRRSVEWRGVGRRGNSQSWTWFGSDASKKGLHFPLQLIHPTNHDMTEPQSSPPLPSTPKLS